MYHRGVENKREREQGRIKMGRRGSYKKRKGISLGPKGHHSHKSNASIFAGSSPYGEIDWKVIYP